MKTIETDNNDIKLNDDNNDINIIETDNKELNDYIEDIRYYKGKLDWSYISRYFVLDEKFIEKYSNKIYWYYISAMQKLSMDFIEKFSDVVDWHFISEYQKLNESFIEKNKHKVDWSFISKYQVLSESFIEKHCEYVYWDFISKYQRLSSEFIKKHKLTIPKDSWMYKDREYKRNKIKEIGLYEINGDCVIAYKAIRYNNYSVFNLMYHYEIGKVYESNADYNPENEDSFGLSAWTYEKAKLYYDRGRIMKIKIHLDDIACVVHQGHKLRCTRIEILKEVY